MPVLHGLRASSASARRVVRWCLLPPKVAAAYPAHSPMEEESRSLGLLASQHSLPRRNLLLRSTNGMKPTFGGLTN